MKSTFALTFLLLPFMLFSQNYRLFNPAQIRLFGHQNLTLGHTQFDHATIIDSSIVVGADTLWYNYRIAKPSSAAGCSFTYGDTSWLNDYYLERAGNSFVFFNANQDSIFFYGNDLGTWKMMDLQGGGTIQASYQGTTWELVNGNLMDSVRNFSLQVIDSASSPIVHPLNGRIFKVSKQLGFVQLMSFWEFPDTLIGHSPVLTMLDTVFVNNEDIWDFQIGDSLHIYKLKFNIQEEIKTFEEFVILSKNYSPGLDSVFYEVAARSIRHVNDWSNPVVVTNFPQQVIQWRIRILPHDQPWDQFPYACKSISSAQLSDPIIAPALFRNWNYGGRMQRSHVEAIEPSINPFDTLNYCFPTTLPTQFWVSHYFGIEGLGGGYYDQSDTLSSTRFQHYPVWYRKGNEIWGTPWNFNELLTQVEMPELPVNIYPNPVDEQLFIEFPPSFSAGTVQIMDLSGREVLRMQVSGNGRVEIGREQIGPAGLYICRIHSGSGLSSSNKIVIH